MPTNSFAVPAWRPKAMPFAAITVAVVIAFSAGFAVGARQHGGNVPTAQPIEPSGPPMVGPLPDARQASVPHAGAAPARATFVAYITGPVDPRLAERRRDCAGATDQDACDEPAQWPSAGDGN
ncbi:MAG TPA: hypothetical protein VKV26_15845 [Dehalococcoidia bacterium]|nr:hypothetical protein [Dehalococcoidia bacterium]